MQISLAALALVAAAIVDAQTASREEYKSICRAEPPKTSKTFSDGHEIEYVCDSAGDSEATLPGSGETTATSDDCAQACKANPSCKASDWYYSTQVCNLYKNAEIGDLVPGSVFMRRVTPPATAPPADASDDLAACKKELQTCNAEKDDLLDELEACRSGREADKKACEDKIKTLEKKLETCEKKLETCEKSTKCEEDPVWQRRKEAIKICGYGGRKKIVAGTSTYTSHCNRRVGPSKFYKQAALSVDECLAQCSKESRCKGVHYVVMNDAHCKFLEAAGTTALPVEGDGDCPTGFMIGFAPTIPK